MYLAPARRAPGLYLPCTWHVPTPARLRPARRGPPAAAGQVHQGADLHRPGQVHRSYKPGTRPVV